MFGKLTEVVKHLLIINVIMFFATTAADSFFDRNNFALFFPASNEFKPYQLITHMFMHGDLNHLLYNMISLFFFGPYLEKYLGSKRFLVFYLLCGFGALLLHMLIPYVQYNQLVELLSPDVYDKILTEGRGVLEGRQIYSDPDWQGLNRILNVPVLGASGAVYGILIGFATLFPHVKVQLLIPPIPIKAMYLALGLLAYDVYSGFAGSATGIAHFAHIGGAIAGFLLILMWKKNKFT